MNLFENSHNEIRGRYPR